MIFTLLFACVLFASASQAETIETRLPSGLMASASFHRGNPGKPAILITHGFLQTSESLPMKSLAENLASKGYTILGPTISLGINRRSQIMQCDAVHTHTMESEVEEISFWVNWLQKNNFKSIILIGFSSTGNLAILLYNARQPAAAIRHTILTSLNPMQTNIKERQAARNSGDAARSKSISTYSLGYCKKNYAATRNSYLSYAEFDEAKVLNMLQNMRTSADLILGTADTVLPHQWRRRIESLQAKLHLHTITNAGHFFDGTHELDLTETVENILEQLH